MSSTPNMFMYDWHFTCYMSVTLSHNELSYVMKAKSYVDLLSDLKLILPNGIRLIS